MHMITTNIIDRQVNRNENTNFFNDPYFQFSDIPNFNFFTFCFFRKLVCRTNIGYKLKYPVVRGPPPKYSQDISSPSVKILLKQA